MSTRVIITGAAVLFVLAAPSFGAAAPVTYNGSTGDNPGGADIGAVTADLGADGKIAIELSIASMPQFGAQALAVVGIDTGPERRHGRPLRRRLRGRLRLRGAQPRLSALGRERLRRRNRRRHLDPGQRIREDPGASGRDRREDRVQLQGRRSHGRSRDRPGRRRAGCGLLGFEAKKVLTVDTVDAKFVPLAPRAGFVFQAPVVRIMLSDGTTILAPKYRCVAQLGGKLLRGKGRGGCTFALPKNAKGKRLLVTLFVTYKGVTDEFKPYVLKVR